MCKCCKVDENGENTDNYIFAPAKAKGLSSDEFAEFSVNYCPMYGRKL